MNLFYSFLMIIFLLSKSQSNTIISEKKIINKNELITKIIRNSKINQNPFYPSLTSQTIFNILTSNNDCDNYLCISEIINKINTKYTTSKFPKIKENSKLKYYYDNEEINKKNFILNNEIFLNPLIYSLNNNNYLNGYVLPYNFIFFIGGSIFLKYLDKNSIYEKFKNNINIARYSVGMSNLYNMYLDRLPILEKYPNKEFKKNRSNSEFKSFLANRRLFSKKWNNKIKKSNDTEILREIAFILSEMQTQIYNIEVKQEKILETLSVLQIQNLK